MIWMCWGWRWDKVATKNCIQYAEGFSKEMWHLKMLTKQSVIFKKCMKSMAFWVQMFL